MITFPNGLSITSYHPIIYNKEWRFPIEVGTAKQVYVEAYYNFVLKNGTSLMVNQVPCISLGHGLKGEVAGHDYLGTDKVIKDLQ